MLKWSDILQATSVNKASSIVLSKWTAWRGEGLTLIYCQLFPDLHRIQQITSLPYTIEPPLIYNKAEPTWKHILKS